MQMSKKLTITVSDQVYEGLQREAGSGRIGSLVEHLLRNHVLRDQLAADYAEAAADEEREREAKEWVEADLGDTLPDEDFSDWPGYPSR
jgi:hypothetical protein